MCVIAIAQTKRPTEEMIRKMWLHNDDGFGIAYRAPLTQGKNKGKLGVFWQKGIEKLEDAIKLCNEVPLPYVAHFRIASQGGIDPNLTHPFPVDTEVSLALKGQTLGSVLFHNGDWTGWRHQILIPGRPLPKGDKMSDTRAMAFMVSIYGSPYMDIIDEKGVIFSPDTLETFTGKTGWIKVDGIWCSNNYFNLHTFTPTHNPIHQPWLGVGAGSYYQGGGDHTPRTSPRMCYYGTCTETLLDWEGYCLEHRKDHTRKFIPIYGRPLPTSQKEESKVIELPGSSETTKIARDGVKEGNANPTQTSSSTLGTDPNGNVKDSKGEEVAPTLTPFQAVVLARQQRKVKAISKGALKRAEHAYTVWCKKADKEHTQSPLTP